MDLLYIIIGGVLMLVGIAGSVLPVLPGPPLCFIALLIQQLRSDPPFNASFLWTFFGITIAVAVLEYLIPIYGTKKYGGTKYGVWGCTLGIIVGIFFGPVGIIIGPFVGAFIGEMLANSNSQNALKASLGSFIGFLTGTLLKLVACFVMAYYFVVTW